MRLQGKNIILTGASRGFGQYLAGVLWNEGANLLLIARRDMSFLLPDARVGQQRSWMPVNLLERTAASVVIGAVKHLWECRVDGLINNAAIQGPVGPAWESSHDEWTDTVKLDLLAPVKLCQQIVRLMLDYGSGKIVNLSGGGATSARPNYSAYATAKTGLVRFSECLAAELAGTGIDVNCVSPGAMPTDMLPPGVTPNPDAMQKAAELIVFLLSDESNGITGKLVSSLWDDLDKLKTRRRPLPDDVYTLRRETD